MGAGARSTGAVYAAELRNGDFESAPNEAWRTVSPAAAGPGEPADAPWVAVAGLGRFGRVGDHDGRDRNAPSPTSFFQSFRVEPAGTAPESPPAWTEVQFKFRSSVRRGEYAWVRLAPVADPDAARIWRMPGTSGRWKGPITVAFPGTGVDLIAEFGLSSVPELDHVGSTVDIDDVAARAVPAWADESLLPAPEIAELLPAVPTPGAGEPLRWMDKAKATGPGLLALGLAAAFVTFFLLIVLRKAREPSPRELAAR